MKREIKFRAWDTKGKYFLPLDDDADYYFRDDANGLEVWDKGGRRKDAMLLQFTGLHDKNGKEIYEGDILMVTHVESIQWKKEYKDTGVVEFGNQGAFILKCRKGGHENAKDESKRYFYISFKPDRQFEIIGNIYENENLLKDAKID